jgi:hypothetical protein
MHAGGVCFAVDVSVDSMLLKRWFVEIMRRDGGTRVSFDIK